MNDVVEVQKTAKLLPTALATALGLLPVTQACLAMSFTTPAIVYYRRPDITIISAPLTDDQVSWLASVSSALMFAGTLASSLLTDRLGRKLTLALGGMLQVLAWALLLVSQEFGFLMSNRILSGISAGLTQPATLTYLSDISPVWLRGPLGVMSILTMNGSWMLSLGVVALLDFQICIKIMIVPIMVFFVLAKRLPESPVWLVKKGRIEAAEEALRALRGQEYDVGPEMKELRETQNMEMKANLANTKNDNKINILSRQFLYPMALMFGLCLMQGQLGIDLLSYYSLDIFSALNLPLDKYLLSLLQQASVTAAYLLSAGLASRVPRRKHFLAATTAFTLLMMASAVCLQTKEETDESAPMELRALLFPLALIASFAAYGIGVGSVIFSIVGEIFPPNLKGTASGIIFGVRNASVFLVLKLFPALRAWLGLRGIFVMQAAAGLVSFLIALFFMPETLGLSLSQLSLLFAPKKSKKKRPNQGVHYDNVELKVGEKQVEKKVNESV